MTNQTSIPFMQLRGGSSKGVYFKAEDLPADETVRDGVLKWVMGAYGDARQVDGLGGGHPLTSKIALIAPSKRPGVDIDYHFIQAIVGEDRLDDTPNCGNILSGVGAFALESGMLKASGSEAEIAVYMTNSGNRCRLRFPIANGLPVYEGDAHIDGVMGRAAPVMCLYENLAGSACGALLPTGNEQDNFAGFTVSCIDNGMPLVAMRAQDFGIEGDERPEDLNANTALKDKLEAVRLEAGHAMGLGDVTHKAIPKMCLVSKARTGTAFRTRTFIPKVCHQAIGVLAAVSVASCAIRKQSVIHDLADIPKGDEKNIRLAHPSGFFDVQLVIQGDEIVSAGLLRTTRLLSRGDVYVPHSVWRK